MPTAERQLRRNLMKVLRQQGYEVKRNGEFTLAAQDRETYRAAHKVAKAERLRVNKNFIRDNLPLIQEHFIGDKKIEVEKIDPCLIEVEAGSKWETIFRWWNLMWWSLPYEQAYGRQMRFVVWDRYHRSPIGLIGLQSPILSWSVRDTYLGIKAEDRDYWVNQSMNAQRLGALPPYNEIIGSKLVASLMTSDVVRKKFTEKYSGKKTLLKKRKLPAQLLFVTTTGAYGKSSVYSRLKHKDEIVAEYLGNTRGAGSFHIPNWLYEDLIDFLEQKGISAGRGYGNGPSRKLKLIKEALGMLGFSNGVYHGIERSIYLFPLAKNLNSVIKQGAKPKWVKRSIKEIAEFWKTRWAIPRVQRDPAYLDFNAGLFLKALMQELDDSLN